MAGHSKFKNIMHRKNAQDTKKAKVFSCHIRAISIAAQEGIDLDINFKLRNAILAAKIDNVPKENIERALRKNDDLIDLKEIRYEGYGPANLAVIVETLTNNRNRTAKELRNIFNCNNGNMGESGSVAFMFKHCGIFYYSKDVSNFEDFIDVIIGCNVQDCYEHNNHYEVIVDVKHFGNTQKCLESKFGSPIQAYLAWIPDIEIEAFDEDLEKIEKFLDALNNLDDVQKVFSNLKIND